MEDCNPFGGPQQIEIDDSDSIKTVGEACPVQYVHVALDCEDEDVDEPGEQMTMRQSPGEL